MKNLNQDILKYINDAEQETIDLLEQLAKIPAPSGQEDLRAEFVKNWLIDAGAKNVYIDSVKNVICPIGCDGKDDIVTFVAHTDVVFPDTTPLPFKKDDKYFYCPGIGDDTACLVAMLMIVKYIVKNNLTAPTGILFVANSCEEGLGNLKGTRQLMKDFDGRIKKFYSFDSNYDSIYNKPVGSHRYEIEFTTEGGHSFGAFGNRNAIAAMSKVIAELYECVVPKKEGAKTTYNVGIVEGGTSVNTIAQYAKMLYEYRSDDRECLDSMKNYFNNVIEKAKQKNIADIHVNMIGERPCSGDVDQSVIDQMVEHAKAISEKHSGLPCALKSASTDCNIPLSLGIPSICVGTHISDGTHTREERLLISSLPIGLKIVAEVILSYFD